MSVTAQRNARVPRELSSSCQVQRIAFGKYHQGEHGCAVTATNRGDWDRVVGIGCEGLRPARSDARGGGGGGGECRPSTRGGAGGHRGCARGADHGTRASQSDARGDLHERPPPYHSTLELPIDFPWLRGPRGGSAAAERGAAEYHYTVQRDAAGPDAAA